MEPKTPRRTCKGGKQPAAIPGEGRAKPGTTPPPKPLTNAPAGPGGEGGRDGGLRNWQAEVKWKASELREKDKSGDNIEEKEKRKEIKEEKIKKLKKKR